MACEFNITTDLAPIQNTVIEGNFAEVRAYLEDAMRPYASLVITEDGVKDGKAIRATINKITSRIEDQRKLVKNVYSEPLKLFESRCRELTDICTSASGNIDRQIKEFEERQKQERCDALMDFFAERVGELADYLGFSDIFDPRWLNASADPDKCREAISAAIAKCDAEITSIRSLGSPWEAALLDYYRSKHDLAGAINKNAELQRLRDAEEKRRAEEAAKIVSAAPQSRPSVREAEPVFQPVETPPLPQSASEASEPIVTTDFRVTCTRSQLLELGNYMRAAGIQYGRVPQN